VTINIQQYSNDYSLMQYEVVFGIEYDEDLTIFDIDICSMGQ